jgi:rhamnosyltransferase
MTPTVSVVIPTRNGMASLPGVFEALASQRAPFAVEIVGIDSDSTDGTAEWLATRVDVLLRVKAGEFGHGRTRNQAIARTRGTFVVLLVQDARPLGRDWLRTLVAPLSTDERVAGTFARQVPSPTAGAVAREYSRRWVAASDESRLITIANPAQFDTYSPRQRLEHCAFDNVCSCIRRAVWESRAFPDVPIAEDLWWARTVLLDGQRLAFVADATVEHSHDRSSAYELKRTWVLHQQLFHLFGLRTIPSLSTLMSAIASSLALHGRLLRESGERRDVRTLARAAGLAVAWPLGQYLGGWTAAAGRDGWRPSGV